MAALVYPLTIEQGVEWSRDLHLVAGESDYDLTGYTPRMQIRAGYGSGETLAAEATCSVTDAVAGEMTISLTSTQTAALSAPRYYYDLILVGPSPSTGVPQRLLQGAITVSPRVTRG